MSLLLRIGLPLLCLVAVGIITSRSTFLAAVLVWVAFFWDGYWFGVESPIIYQTQGEMNFHLMDLVASVILAGAVIRLIAGRTLSIPQKLLIAFGAVVALSFVRGVADCGLQAAGNDFRSYLYFLSVALYFSTFSLTARDLKHLEYLWLIATAILVVAALGRWMFLDVPDTPGAWSGAGGYTLRVLNAWQTLVLGQTLFMLLLSRRRSWSAGMSMVATVVLGVVILVLQHRTVWAVLLASGALVIWKDPRLRSRLGLVAIAGLAIFVILVMSDIGTMLLSSLGISIGEATSRKSTFTWRIEGWWNLLSNMSVWDFILGKPFGSGYFRGIHGGESDLSPHSLYVTTIVRTGLPGVVLLIALYVRTLRGMKLCRSLFLETSYFTPRILSILLVAQLVYGIAYSLRYEQGLILGVAMAMAAVKLPGASRSGARTCGSRRS
ncbi:MAG TPA: hypothetical protein ENH84_02770 [Phycisphaerae bacterium]|nr:hypothetical protein [Phycisphaerae bacterium]